MGRVEEDAAVNMICELLGKNQLQQTLQRIDTVLDSAGLDKEDRRRMIELRQKGGNHAA